MYSAQLTRPLLDYLFMIEMMKILHIRLRSNAPIKAAPRVLSRGGSGNGKHEASMFAHSRIKKNGEKGGETAMTTCLELL
jgi:hypothetical protein